MKRGILEGIVVLDMTTALSGPFSSMLLADLGADVIKLEMPGEGDGVRKWGPPFIDDSGATYIGFNRNKRSLELDLHIPQDVETFRTMVAASDVVIENFRPGTMRRFGVGYDSLKAIKPDLIYCAISGYGQTGPMAHLPAMDLMIQATSGVMSLTGEPEGRPVKAAVPVADLSGGFSASVAILAALYDREKTGEGRHIDISMLDATLLMLGQSVATHGMDGKTPRRLGNAHALMAPYQSFRTATREIVISLANQKRWDLVCSLPEFAPLASEPDYQTQALRNKNRTVLCQKIEAILMTRPAGDWLAAMRKLGLPAAPVNSLEEILGSDHVRETGSLLEVEYPEGSGNRVTVAGPPWRDVAVDGVRRQPPTVGQHNEEVLRQFGLNPAKRKTG